MIRNTISGNIIGLFNKRSHLTGSGFPKVRYSTKASAEKAAKKMGEKHGVYFSNYRCMFCGGFHLGKNRAKEEYQS